MPHSQQVAETACSYPFHDMPFKVPETGVQGGGAGTATLALSEKFYVDAVMY